MTVLVDDPHAWIVPYARKLVEQIENYDAVLIHRHEELEPGRFLFCLGCTRILSSYALSFHERNLIIHESSLPEGRGFSPVSWQVLERKERIPICLIEASGQVDAGPVFLEDEFWLDGSELFAEIKRKQAAATKKIVMDFLARHEQLVGKEQMGEASYYRQRSRADDEVFPDERLGDIFEKLRICNPSEFPVWFFYRGKRYKLQIDYLEEHNASQTGLQ